MVVEAVPNQETRDCLLLLHQPRSIVLGETTMKHVGINIRGELYQSDGADHVLLSIEDYNKLVRQLNNMAVLLMEHEPKPINNKFVDLMLKHKLSIIEDENAS